MSAKQLTAMAIRLLALWLLVQLVLVVPLLFEPIALISTELELDIDKSSYYIFIGSFLVTCFVILVILFRVSNSVLTIAPDSGSPTSSNISQMFLLQVLGVYFAVTSLAEIPGFLYAFVISGQTEYHQHWYFVGELFALLFGLYLLMRPFQIQRILRNFGGQK